MALFQRSGALDVTVTDCDSGCASRSDESTAGAVLHTAQNPMARLAAHTHV